MTQKMYSIDKVWAEFKKGETLSSREISERTNISLRSAVIAIQKLYKRKMIKKCVTLKDTRLIFYRVIRDDDDE